MPAPTTAEYIVVGSGPGGGTVAARLALSGHTVLVLEAGGDPWHMRGGRPLDPHGNRLPEDYRVPAFHALATENPALKWDFWVKHYDETENPARDPKYYERFPRDTGPEVNGVWYPRAGALGGCSAHNAMIFVYPHNQDWQGIADLTGDRSWEPDRMRAYFERLENCQYRSSRGNNPARHGFNGWLSTERAVPGSALRDFDLLQMLLSASSTAMAEIGQPFRQFGWNLESNGDPNDWRLVEDDAVGVRFTPLTTQDHTRVGTRELLRQVQARCPDHLFIELDALATKVVLEKQADGTQRAAGVEYLKGARLYRAHHAPSTEAGESRSASATRDVILAGGAFNTPQLLMLSGVGPQEELSRHGIDRRIHLAGVGKNLQDRYEVTVVNRMTEDWEILEGARFDRRDALYAEWARRRSGVYTSNGAVLSLIARSQQQTAPAPPDLFLFGLLANFKGYEPHYTKNFPSELNYLSWAILKAHTQNNRGSVTLRSSDPRDRPEIHFRYFDHDPEDRDVEGVVDGVELARKIIASDNRLQRLIEEEESPGTHVVSRADLKEWVKEQAWGHHACGTCPIGVDERTSVLDSNFKVHHTQNLRVVDASVFPRIPGFFIASSIYMVGEKAADVIAADGAREPRGA